MATESCTETSSREERPRWLSFSQDLFIVNVEPEDYSDDPAAVHRGDDQSMASYDFDFSASYDVSLQDTSLADELFLDGKILPLPLKSPSLTQPLPMPVPEPLPTVLEKRVILEEVKKPMSGDVIDVKDNQGMSSNKTSAAKAEAAPAAASSEHCRASFWQFGRSSSVNDAASSCNPRASVTICLLSLLRSKSTGSKLNPGLKEQQMTDAAATKKNSNNSNNVNGRSHTYNSNSNINGNSHQFLRRVSSESNSNNSNSKTYYYSGNSYSRNSSGVKISPILNVPVVSFSTRGNSNSNKGNWGLFGWIMCN